MKLVVECGGRREEVDVEALGAAAYRVRVGERDYRVDAADVGAGLRSLRVDGAQHEVGVHAAPGSGENGVARYRVSLSALVPPHEVVVLDPLTDLARRGRGGAAAGGRREVVAMMPGRVVAVLAAEGSEVAAGAGVVVVEAMKMENEIAAETAGVIGKLYVEAGQTVEAGDPLFTIEEPSDGEGSDGR